MNEKSFFKTSLYIAGIIVLVVSGLLFWDYFHGGVPSHHLLAKKNLPEVSNWWGIVTFPLATAILLYRIKKRMFEKNDLISQQQSRNLIISFVGAFVYAAAIAVSFATGNSQISGILFPLIFAIALFIPIYKAEYILGFMVGLLYTFGGFLPVFISVILAAISYLLYQLLHRLMIKIGKLMGLVKSKNVS